jgi:hypothetical protein
MEAFNQKFAKVIEKAWADEAFKARLVASPVDVLKESGIDVPAGMQVKVVENTADVRYFVLPAQPDQLSDNDLDKVAGGSGSYPNQGAIGGLGSGDTAEGGTLFAPPTNTDFSTASGLGTSASSFKLGGN